MQKLKYKSDKVNNLKKTAKQNYPGSVDSYDTRPGNEVGLFYNDKHTWTPKPTQGEMSCYNCIFKINITDLLENICQMTTTDAFS